MFKVGDLVILKNDSFYAFCEERDAIYNGRKAYVKEITPHCCRIEMICDGFQHYVSFYDLEKINY